MNCQPFEAWLLEDKILSPEEKRELDAHLRACRRCAALFETGFALRVARAVPPAPGFAARFEKRLAAQKAAAHRRRMWGVLLLSFTGVGAFGWLVFPLAYIFLSSPAERLTSLVASLLFVVTSLQAAVEAFSALTKALLGVFPPYAWMMFFSALAGFCLLWAVSLWRVSRASQGVRA